MVSPGEVLASLKSRLERLEARIATRQAQVTSVDPLRVFLDDAPEVEIGIDENFHATPQVGQRVLVARELGRWVMAGVPPAPWQTPAMLNGWEDWGGSFAPVGWRITPYGIQLRGLIRRGTVDEPAFTVGPGLVPHPSVLTAQTYPGGETTCRINVGTDGSVTPTTNANALWVSLDGLLIPTAP